MAASVAAERRTEWESDEMSEQERREKSVSRRGFVQGASLLAGAAMGSVLPGVAHAAQTDAGTPVTLGKRMLGRTGERVSMLTLGTAPLGQGPASDKEGQALVERALELGVNYFDTARIYGNAERFLAPVLKRNRDKMFLATKVWADEVPDFDKLMTQSFRTLGVDHVDLMHIHSLGNKDIDKLLATGGVMDFLEKKKEQGVIRFIGISGHNYPSKFKRMVDTGRVDVMMVAMNFADRHTYDFERRVLPAARAQNMGVACMKVYGGVKATPDSPWTNYQKVSPCQMPEAFLPNAVRYSLSLPGVATAVIGVHSIAQLEQNVAFAKAYQPLSDVETASLENYGKELAEAWGPRFGAAT